MHLLQSYALESASKIDRSFLFEQFIPLPEKRYITFQPQSKFPSKDYSYWQTLLNLIHPFLQKENIEVVQIGIASERLYSNVIDYRGKTNFGQLAFLIKNAILHFGTDSFGVHIASSYEIPIVSLYSIIQSSVAGPVWGNKKNNILFDAYLRTESKKPSYSAQENPKTVDLINPEEIGNAILKLLGIDFKFPFETIFIGKQYTNLFDKIREYIPNEKNVNFGNPDVQIEVRMDLNFDEEILIKQLQVTKCAIVTNKPINLTLLKNFKSRIHAVVYVIDENDNPEFPTQVRKLGIPLLLISRLSQEEINKKKIDYFDLGNINKIFEESVDKITKLSEDINNLYYTSNKMVIFGEKVYNSNAARLADIPANDFEYQKAIHSEEWFKDLNFYHIVKKLNKL